MIKYLSLFLLLSCAVKHHVQVGDIHSPPGKKLMPFTILVSETGVNLEAAADLTSAVLNDDGRAKRIQEIISMFQMGPRTGNLVFNENYADAIPKLVLKKCPTGEVTGLLMVRESNQYPVVSGEIVKVSGYCII